MLQVRRDLNRIKDISNKKDRGMLAKYGDKDKILLQPLAISDNNDSLTTVMKTHTDDQSSP